MMPPGHIATTWGVAALLQQYNPRLARLDYRLLAFSALLPDVLDKPLAVLVFTNTQTTQLIAHSLLFHLALLVLALLFWRKALPYVLACNAHLLADYMWEHIQTFWWPLYGWSVFWQYKPMNTPAEMLHVYLDIVRRYPHVWVVEIFAGGVLCWLAYRFGVYRWPVLKHFIMTGRLGDESPSKPAENLIKPSATATNLPAAHQPDETAY